MKLIHTDPYCSGFKIKDIKKGTKKEIKDLLAHEGLDSENCSDVIYYVVINDDLETIEGTLDFS